MYALEGTLTTHEARHCAGTEKGKQGKAIMESATGTIHHEFFQRSMTLTVQRHSSLPVRHYVINTPNFGNFETVPLWHGITSVFSFGTGLSDQEWHNIPVTTSLLPASSPYQLLPFNRNGSALEGKEVRMVALKEVRGKS